MKYNATETLRNMEFSCNFCREKRFFQIQPKIQILTNTLNCHQFWRITSTCVTKAEPLFMLDSSLKFQNKLCHYRNFQKGYYKKSMYSIHDGDQI